MNEHNITGNDTSDSAQAASVPQRPAELRPWAKPTIECMSLKEALSGLFPGLPDSVVGYS